MSLSVRAKRWRASPKERRIHEVAACGVLRDLHDELDRLVADAYGWPRPMETEEILARLVSLHDERVEEEKRGRVRWLRPDYQVPRFGDKVEGDLTLDVLPDEDDDELPDHLPDWPSDPVAQLTALRAVVAEKPRTVEQAARRFKGAVRRERPDIGGGGVQEGAGG
ncbi:MAG: hypothetical protein R6X33_02280 [Candidatus Brocadiia bacterium]